MSLIHVCDGNWSGLDMNTGPHQAGGHSTFSVGPVKSGPGEAWWSFVSQLINNSSTSLSSVFVKQFDNQSINRTNEYDTSFTFISSIEVA